MPRLSVDSVVARRDELLAEDDDGRLAIVHRREQFCFRLTPTGTRIWQLIEKPIAIGALCDALSHEFEAPLPDVLADVLEFLEEALREGLIKLGSGERHRDQSVRNRARRHLFVCLGASTWGEANYGSRVARQLLEHGDSVTVLVRPETAPLFRAQGVHCEVVADLGPQFASVIDDRISELQPSSIVLADYLLGVNLLRKMSINPASLLEHDVPVIAVDTWDSPLAGSIADTFVRSQFAFSGCPELLQKRILPVPHLSPTAQPGKCGLLPLKHDLTARDRQRIRAQLGIPSGHRAILFCTAAWQQMELSDLDGARMADAVPRLLLEYLRNLGPDIHLVHIGHRALDSKEILGDRYHFLPRLEADHFRSVVSCADLMLSLNAVGSTLGNAIVSGIPALVVRNGCSANSLEEATEWLGGPPAPRVAEWLRACLPLYPFDVWPVGYVSFLKPIRVDNPFFDLAETVELLREEEFHQAASRLLRESSAIASQQERQVAYSRQVLALPTAADLILSYL